MKSKVAPRLYIVKTCPGVQYRQNRKDLLITKEMVDPVDDNAKIKVEILAECAT